MKQKELSKISTGHPGYIIKMELKERCIKQKDFAKKINIQQSHLSEILKGTRNISDQLADAIERELNIPAEHIKKLQLDYNYNMKTSQLGDLENHNAEVLLERYNSIYDMKVIFKYIGIAQCSSVEKLEFCRTNLKFMEPTQQRQSYGRFHKSGKTGLDNRMIATWTILAQYEAGKLPAPTTKYDKTLLDKLSGELSLIFHENSNTENRVSRKLSEYGIKFCIVPKVERASIDGYSFVSNGIPSIVITRRYNRIDNLAFAVLHEIGHLKLHGNNGCGRVSVADADEQSTKEEREANEYAANILIPEDTWLNAPKVRMNPRIIQSEYSAWANRQGMNKWIVLGRVSHETGMYMFNSDKSRDIN